MKSTIPKGQLEILCLPRTANRPNRIFRPALLLALIVALNANALPPAHYAESDEDAGRGVGSGATRVSGGSGGTAAAERNSGKRVVIRRLERSNSSEARTPGAWLGVGVSETTEALTAQLQLKEGEGLVVTFVSTNSPAAKAGLKENDVLFKLDDQILVHPAQLRKLVQSHAEGDEIEITVFHRGEKRKVTATLQKAPVGFMFSPDDRGWGGNLKELQRQFEGGPWEGMSHLRESLAKAGIDNDAIAGEIRHSVQEAQKAAQGALRSMTNAHQFWLKDLARGGVIIDNKARIEMTSKNHETRNMVRTDDSGTYVLLANPNKHLTVHSPDGKLLFDGPVESKEDQEKVPSELWEKAKTMIDQLKSDAKENAPEAEEIDSQ